ncbi:MAG TPA: hypothetical protein ENJ01_04395 [Gammaproteobacteria bacterium]|nr:hypothetical protein [Gammaproteobacteria bacterium]
MTEQASGSHKSFWATLPGILTGLAGLITAVVGLLIALNQIGVIGNPNATPPTANGTDVHPHPDQPPPAEPAPPPTTGFRILELNVRARPASYRGKCPVTIRFRGRISVAGGGGLVSYKFQRSDGASAPVQSITFNQPGSKTVTTTWQLGKSFQGWQAIETFDPQAKVSPRAQFKIICTNAVLPSRPTLPRAPTLSR